MSEEEGQVAGATALPEMDQSLKDALGRLDDIKLDADFNIDEEAEGDSPDTGSVGDSSIQSEGSVDKNMETKHKSNGECNSGDTKEKAGKVPKEQKSSVFSRLKKLTKFDKPKKTFHTTTTESTKTKLSDVKVDRLPQLFICKYLGKRTVKGVYGLHYVRKPVDELVGKVKKTLLKNEPVELPLVYVVISNKGIDIREHKNNRIQDGVTYGNIPIDFISYGVQDMKFWKVFTFIVVSELSSRTKKMECHAYLCDSDANARKMALSLGAAFELYKGKLAQDGKAHNFQVELRPPDELAEAFTDEKEEEEC